MSRTTGCLLLAIVLLSYAARAHDAQLIPPPASLPRAERQALQARYAELKKRQADLDRLIADHNARCAHEPPTPAAGSPPISACEAERGHIDFLVAAWRRDAAAYNAAVRAKMRGKP